MAQIINYQELWERIKEYAMKVGRVAVRPVLLPYYGARSEDTPWKDKLTIFGALAYLVFPVDFLDYKRLPIIGWLDDITSLAVAIKGVSKYITPEMEAKADKILDHRFPEYTKYKIVEQLTNGTRCNYIIYWNLIIR